MQTSGLMNNRYEVIRKLAEETESEVYYLVKDQNEGDIE